MEKIITSVQNPYIKNVAVLKEKSRERRQQLLFVAEGLRELGLALKNGFAATALLYDPRYTEESLVMDLVGKATMPPGAIIQVSTPVFEKIAYRASVPNVAGVFSWKNRSFSDLEAVLSKGEPPLLVVVEDVEKPGNLGAMLRTADAAGVHGVIVCDPHADVFHPNVSRASLGAVFSLPVMVTTSQEAADFLKKHGITVFATYLEAAKSLYDCDLRQPSALVLGAESSGISSFWIEQADERIIIPMKGQVDSLNVSAATAAVLFEAVRQRSAIM